ncbi:hypothetical protein DH2020_014760 [Rehmannia glutinosa]|uniref:Auxin response factor domain-containing protein n=1 Tax=Rehmannia glutinosa TaxID=99300 RepID=A0ABR0X110_REHGL
MVSYGKACAGPLVNVPVAGTHVVYFPQGHSEQVAASMKKDVDAQIPNYPNLPSKLLCLLHNVTLHADPETDEVYARMTLQPVPSFDKDALLRSDLSMKSHRPQTEFFCKTLTASDTSTHGGFQCLDVLQRRFSLLWTLQCNHQHKSLLPGICTITSGHFAIFFVDNLKRHLLTTGWSLFVGGKRLIAGDSVLFISLSRASPSEFVIPLAKYYKAVCSNQISLGMRFRMMFETEESGTRRYMGTITGISDMDPVRWKNSQWRNLQVGWDESTAGERRNRVSIWEIEPVTAPFFICPTPPLFRSKRPRIPGMPDDDNSDLDSLFRRTMPWLGDEFGLKDPQSLPGLSLVQYFARLDSKSNFPSAKPTIQFTKANPTIAIFDFKPFKFDYTASTAIDRYKSTTTTEFSRSKSNFTDKPTSVVVAESCSNSKCCSAAATICSKPSDSRNVPQNLPQQQQQQQQILSQIQQQNLMPSQPSDLASQHLQMSDNNQIQFQLLQKLHQQQQSILGQQPSQTTHLQDQQKQILEIPPNFSRPMTTSQMLDSSQATSNMHPQQMTKNNIQTNFRFAQPTQQPKIQQQQSGMLSELPKMWEVL